MMVELNYEAHNFTQNLKPISKAEAEYRFCI